MQDNWNGDNVVNYIGLTLAEGNPFEMSVFQQIKEEGHGGEWFGAVTRSWDVAMKAVLRVSTI